MFLLPGHNNKHWKWTNFSLCGANRAFLKRVAQKALGTQNAVPSDTHAGPYNFDTCWLSEGWNQIPILAP